MRGITLLALSFGLLAAALPASAVAATPITDCGDQTQLRADVAAGGSYAFECEGTIVLTSALVVEKQVSLTIAGSNNVTIEGYDPKTTPPAGSVDRVFFVAANGSLELSGVTVSHGLVSMPPVSTPTHSHNDEKVGCITRYFGWEGGECGPLAPHPTKPGESGSTPTAPGKNGGNAPQGGRAVGGCILIEPGGSATLAHDTVTECSARGSSDAWLSDTGPHGVPGYEQGLGGYGGEGGIGTGAARGGRRQVDSGEKSVCNAEHGEETPAGEGGDGTDGGSGGRGSDGGDALGGAIFDAGSLSVSDTRFALDRAFGGQAGAGGEGGWGGPGGGGSEGGANEVFFECEFDEGASEYLPGGTGGRGGDAGNGGDGGNGGEGEGGAIFAQGRLDVAGSSFEGNLAHGGNGGPAGLGGEGGFGGPGGNAGNYSAFDGAIATLNGGSGGSGGIGGDSGDSGKGGNARGGAIFYAEGATGSAPDSTSVFSSDSVIAGSVCAGLEATPQNCGTAPGPAGEGGRGGISTPCAKPQSGTECGMAPFGAAGAEGAAGTIGAAGLSADADVSGAPGSAPTGSGGGGGSGGSGGSGGGGSGGGAGKAHAGTPKIGHESVTVPIACNGTAPCQVSAALTFQHGAQGRISSARTKGHHPIRVGAASLSVSGGSTGRLRVGLNGLGRRLLKQRHRLEVRLTVIDENASASGAGHAGMVLVVRTLTLHATG